MSLTVPTPLDLLFPAATGAEVKQSTRDARHNRRAIPTLSLFAGAGGLDLGFHQAGFHVLAAVEIEEAYCATLRANVGPDKAFGPNLEVLCQDVREFVASTYANQGIECVIGGPPCQTFSAAGRRSGGVLGTADERGKLFQTYCDILRVVQPKVFVFENVYGLPGANGGGPWREIVNAFSALGYRLRAVVVDAADYGVPQHRERLLMVGYREGDFEFPLPTHGPDSPSRVPFVTAGEAIANLQDPQEPFHKTLGGMYGHLLELVPPGLNYSFFTKEMGHPEPVFAWRSKFHDLLYKVDPDSPTRTIKAQPGKFTGPFHWKNRHFTIQELKRLQTFPDRYDIVGTYGKVVEQIGNSVPPRLAEVLAISVREQLLDSVENLTYPRRSPSFQSSFRQRQRERTHHFKAVAKEEIARRYNLETVVASPPSEQENYYLKISGFFDRERLAEPPAETPVGVKLFEVAVRWDNQHIEIKCKRLGSLDTSLRASVAITGLEKYLGKIDTVNVDALLGETDDVFPVWVIIEHALISRSQFFTLIDIYGHYANRGDTVKIKTVLSAATETPLQKAISHFGNSESCGELSSMEETAALLDLTSRDLHKLIGAMRGVRFDIRTRATHPTIAPGCVVCTYPFPLLGEKVHVERRLKL